MDPDKGKPVSKIRNYSWMTTGNIIEHVFY